MAVTYHEEYGAKKLNEVVLLGSHDAGITKGNANTKTQTKGIFEQAIAGARFFDVRIAGFFNIMPGGSVSLSTYHDATKVALPTSGSKKLTGPGGRHSTKEAGMKIHTTLLGKAGLDLNDVLLEAKAFVESERNEFLMLKFDKSENWPQITNACINVLGSSIYAPTTSAKANINECTLDELKGKVVVLFTADGSRNCGLSDDDQLAAGILQWSNLYSKGQGTAADYDDDFWGLQYYGKGGVSDGTSGTKAKIRVNADEQTQLMQGKGRYSQGANVGRHDGSLMNPKILGLMYWTTTGMSFHGIKARNKKMWSTPNQNLLVQATGFIVDQIGANGPDLPVAKKFMPNIIMVDFVNSHKGQLVKALNTQNSNEINAIIRDGAHA